MGRRIKIAVAALLGVGLTGIAGGTAWWQSVDLSSQPIADPRTVAQDLAFLARAPAHNRGTILAVVTSTAHAKDGAVNAGYELTELSRAYYVFKANGYDVEIASPQGGRPPVNIDEDLTEADYAFLNDPEAQGLLAQTRRLDRVDSKKYAAVYFVGGKGAMFDFRKPAAQNLAVAIHEQGGVVGAVCHGPAALIGARKRDGRPLLAGRSITGFSNEEELFLISDARKVFPFMLEDALRKEAGTYSEAPMYLEHTVVDGRIITGQNPWSTWSVAENMIRVLGHEPVARAPTREENAVTVLSVFKAKGREEALAMRSSLPDADKRLILLHALIAAMNWRLGEAIDVQRLAH